MYFRRRLLLLLLIGINGLSSAVFASEPPRVQLQTNYGDITLELYPDRAPQTVANFLQYVNDGFYDGTIFHRVIKDFMIQGGGFDTNYRRKPTGKPIQNEAENGLLNKRGTVAMARMSAPHSATAQFFINVVDNDYLDFKSKTNSGWGYCVFARVVEGMELVDEISTSPTGPAGPFAQNAPQGLITINTVIHLNPNNTNNEEQLP